MGSDLRVWLGHIGLVACGRLSGTYRLPLTPSLKGDVTMARLNARQKRASKRRIALHELALARNPSTIAQMGQLRASTNVKTVLTSYRKPQDRWEGVGSKIRKGSKLWSGKAPNIEFVSNDELSVGVSDPTSPKAPKDDVAKPKKGG